MFHAYSYYAREESQASLVNPQDQKRNTRNTNGKSSALVCSRLSCLYQAHTHAKREDRLPNNGQENPFNFFCTFFDLLAEVIDRS
jgi:hypothetical protein